MRIITRTVVLFVIGIALAATARAGEPITALLDPYFKIQSQLTADKTDGISADAAAIATHAQAIGDPGKNIVAAAEALAKTTSLDAARTAFAKLSDAVIAYAEQTKTNPGDGVNAMYCPMVKKSWLQKGDKVRNPYLGSSMPSCGEKKKIG
jgi:membrane fusion protein, copper/silver efflux system